MTTASERMRGGLSGGTAVALGGAGSTLAAAGSAQGDAAAILTSIVIVTGADGSKGVILPADSIGDDVWVFNNAGSTLKVYPNSGAAISVGGTGLGTADAAFSQLTNKASVYKRQSATQWFVITSV